MDNTDTGNRFEFEETVTGGRYFMTMPNGEQSRLTFLLAGEGQIIANHTFVPPPYRGDGIAEAMVERLFADARAKGLKITPTCWFVADEFKRHSPKWDDVRA
ncbi:MAG: GNAT family N-acetyltransferase [Rhizobiaceae bacterium]